MLASSFSMVAYTSSDVIPLALNCTEVAVSISECAGEIDSTWYVACDATALTLTRMRMQYVLL